MPVADDIDERHQNVEPGFERAGVAAEPFDDVGALLRHYDCRLCEHDQEQNHKYDNREYASGHDPSVHVVCYWPRRCRVKPSTFSTLHLEARAIGKGPTL